MSGDTIRPNVNITRKTWGGVRKIAIEKGVNAEVVVEELLREGLARRAGARGDRTTAPLGRGAR